MNNFNIVIDGASKKITKELVMGEQLNMREISLLDGKQVQNLLPASINNYNGSMVVDYDISVLVSANEYFKNISSIGDVFVFLEQIITTFIQMQDYYLTRKKLIFNFDYIMVNPTMKKIFFVYFPVMGFDNKITVNNFLIEFIKNINVEDDSNLLENFVEYLNGNEQLELIAIKKFIDRLSISGEHKDDFISRVDEIENKESVNGDVQVSIPNVFELDTPVIKSNTQEL